MVVSPCESDRTFVLLPEWYSMISFCIAERERRAVSGTQRALAEVSPHLWAASQRTDELTGPRIHVMRLSQAYYYSSSMDLSVQIERTLRHTPGGVA